MAFTCEQENALKNVICNMAAILSWPQCLKITNTLETSPSEIQFKICVLSGKKSWYNTLNFLPNIHN